MSTLAEALDALVAVAREAGLDEAAARAEGEAVAATVSERSRGAFVAWSEQTGRAVSAEEHQLAAKRAGITAPTGIGIFQRGIFKTIRSQDLRQGAGEAGFFR